MKRLLIAVALVVFAASVIAGAAALQTQRFMNTPVSMPEEGVTFEIPAGSSFSSVARRRPTG